MTSSGVCSPGRRLARSTNSHLRILSISLVGKGGSPSAITDEEVFGLSNEGSLNQLPKSPRDGRVGVDLVRIGSVGSSGSCPAPREGRKFV